LHPSFTELPRLHLLNILFLLFLILYLVIFFFFFSLASSYLFLVLFLLFGCSNNGGAIQIRPRISANVSFLRSLYAVLYSSIRTGSFDILSGPHLLKAFGILFGHSSYWFPPLAALSLVARSSDFPHAGPREQTPLGSPSDDQVFFS